MIKAERKSFPRLLRSMFDGSIVLAYMTKHFYLYSIIELF